MSDANRLLARLARLPITYRAAELLVEGGARWETVRTDGAALDGVRAAIDRSLSGLRPFEGSRPLGVLAPPPRAGIVALEQALLGAGTPLVAFARSTSLDLRLDHEARAYAVWDDGLGGRFASAAFDSAWHYLEVIARLGADRFMPDWSRAPAHIEVWFQGAPAAEVAGALDLDAVAEGSGEHIATWESALHEAALIDVRVAGIATHAVVVVRAPGFLSRVGDALARASAAEIWLPRGKVSPVLPRFVPMEIGATSPVLGAGAVNYWTHERSALHLAAPPGIENLRLGCARGCGFRLVVASDVVVST